MLFVKISWRTPSSLHKMHRLLILYTNKQHLLNTDQIRPFTFGQAEYAKHKFDSTATKSKNEQHESGWRCINCAFLNFPSRLKCKKCENGVPTEEQFQEIRRNQWICAECGILNRKDGDCWHCKSPKPVTESVVAGTSRLDGSWYCSNCANVNFPTQFKCRKCEKGVPTEEQLQTIRRVQWNCAECGFLNYFNSDCWKCKSPRRLVKSVTGTSQPDGSWYCSSCAHLNFPNQFKCRKCEKGEPTKEQFQAIRRVQWTCAECRILNYRDGDCYHCNSPKRVGESVAGTSLEDGSWYCSNCAHLNFSHQCKCQKCENGIPTEEQLQPIRRILWTCAECGLRNNRDNNCWHCKSPKRVAKSVAGTSLEDGSWYCSNCAYLNFPNQSKCKKCEKGMPTKEQLQAIRLVQWICAECGLQNYEDGNCWHCKSPKRIAKSVAGTSLEDGSWYCFKCEHLNFPGRKICDRCNTAPTEDQLRVIIEVLPPLIDDGSGSWRCSSCAHLNFPNHFKCKKCKNGIPTEEQLQTIRRVQWNCAECGLYNHGDGDCRHCKSSKRIAKLVADTSLSNGSWYCTNCANLNFASNFKCRKCEIGVPTKEQFQAIRRVQWNCAECGSLNYEDDDCWKCKSPKRVAQSVVGISRPDGSWYCSNCAHLNFPNHFKCRKCKNGIPTKEQLQAIRRVQWICAECGLLNHSDGDCRHCKSPKRVAKSVAGPSLKDGSWYCSNCVHLNFYSQPKCKKCEKGMPTKEQLQAIRRVQWTCAECGLQNYEDGDCWHCKSPKRIAKSVAGTSRPDGTWYCSKCDFLNFPSRQICDRCNTAPTEDQLRVIIEVLPPSNDDGSWHCSSCAHLNFSSQFKCRKCGKGEPTEEQFQAIRRVQWICAECGLPNHKDGDCRHCKSPKRVAKSVAGTSLENGSWYCSICAHLNLFTCLKCRKCENGVPTEEQLQAIRRVYWTCAECGLQNQGDGDCRHCKSPKLIAKTVAGNSRPDGSWYCSNCSRLNFPTNSACSKCKTGIPSEEQQQTIRRVEWICAKCGLQNHKDGDCWNCKSSKQIAEPVADTSLPNGSWYCSNCSRLNTPNRNKCLRCHADPTEQQLAAILAALPPPIADGSWYCSSCAQLNWPIREKCKKCQEPATEAQREKGKLVGMQMAGRTLDNGVWLCSNCGNANLPTLSVCESCEGGTPTEKQQKGIDQIGIWTCTSCAHRNHARNEVCEQCKKGEPNEEQRLRISQSGVWTCTICNAKNGGYRKACLRCKGVKPS